MQLFDEKYSYNKNMEIGNIIRQLRKEKKLSQTELAREIFTTQDTISLWELGKSLPDAMSIVKLAKFFDVSADYLLGLEDLY